MRENNRRDFLKAGAMMSATAATLAVPYVSASSKPAHQNRTASRVRILGSGKNMIEVNDGLGLGCMGMSWNRSFVPDRDKMIVLIRKAYDMGVNLFDTAEAYGPYVTRSWLARLLRRSEETSLFAASLVLSSKTEK